MANADGMPLRLIFRGLPWWDRNVFERDYDYQSNGNLRQSAVWGKVVGAGRDRAGSYLGVQGRL
jgi:hypothetical protein